jgi:hypothetical protein
MYGFGDAVCVPAIAWIDRNILTPVYEKAIARGAEVEPAVRATCP